MKSYKNYIKILESKNFQKKVEKQKQKIKKFLKYEPIIDWIFENFVSETTEDNQDSGLKYTIWFAQQTKKQLAEYYSNNMKYQINTARTKDSFFYEKRQGYIEINKEILKKTDNVKEYIFKYLETNKGDNWEWFDDIDTKIKKKIIENIDKYWYSSSDNFNNDLVSIRDWLVSPIRTEQINLNDLSYDDAYNKSYEWHNSLESTGIIENESGNVFMTFDDGYYWIDLEKKICRDEADAMGHCGSTSYGDTLWSLRKDKKPHVTVSYGDGVIYQMKGKNNYKPIDKYHTYIVDLLINPDLNIKGFSSEYNTVEDFKPEDLDKELYDKLLKVKPKIEEPIYSKYMINQLFFEFLNDKNFINFIRLYKDIVGLNDIMFDDSNWNDIKLYHNLCNTLMKNLKSVFGDFDYKYKGLSFKTIFKSSFGDYNNDWINRLDEMENNGFEMDEYFNRNYMSGDITENTSFDEKVEILSENNYLDDV